MFCGRIWVCHREGGGGGLLGELLGRHGYRQGEFLRELGLEDI